MSREEEQEKDGSRDGEYTLEVEGLTASLRLDAWLARTDASISRARWQRLIENGDVMLNGAPAKASQRLHGGEVVECTLPPPETLEVKPENLPIAVLFEDKDLLVVNKAPGMVVHPAPGHYQGTLVNALLFHCSDLGTINGTVRPGIVHRLDKDTSGALVVAKNDFSMQALSDQFRDRTIHKEYVALVHGHFTPPNGMLRTLIGRSMSDRKKMSVRVERGREAVTHYRTEERFAACSWMRVKIETGRTHQIRVHMAHAGHPVLGDRVYGRTPDRLDLPSVARQMLHAEKLVFRHPRTGEKLECTAPLFPDMQEVLNGLRMENG
ncbi:MAG: RluA family pseudouridine synthase [Kiritimatiellae bacterium]|nr:RluA family pseudouridine synthase [Kiritimatiellia bacterium]